MGQAQSLEQGTRLSNPREELEASIHKLMSERNSNYPDLSVDAMYIYGNVMLYPIYMYHY